MADNGSGQHPAAQATSVDLSTLPDAPRARLGLSQIDEVDESNLPDDTGLPPEFPQDADEEQLYDDEDEEQRQGNGAGYNGYNGFRREDSQDSIGTRYGYGRRPSPGRDPSQLRRSP